ncbi:TPA: phage tail protein [Enterobacter cloacae]
MTAKYFAILTNQGAARLANAAALGTKLNLTQMAVGDANGTLPTPDPAQTKLINQKRIAPLNLLTVDPANTSQIIAEQIIPENEGGFWIREIGLYDDDGILIAVANCPETYKPQLQEGSGRTQTIRMILIVSSTSSITLKIDPSVVLATRKYADDKAIELKLYVDDLMSKHLAAADPHSQYATKDSPTFTGKPKAPTPPVVANDTQVATAGFVQAVIAALVSGELANKQPLDKTLTDLSGKDVAAILEYLGIGTAGTKNVGTSNDQVPVFSKNGLGGSGYGGVLDGADPGSGGAVGKNRFGGFLPTENAGPYPGEWVSGICVAASGAFGWQLMGRGNSDTPALTVRSRKKDGTGFSEWYPVVLGTRLGATVQMSAGQVSAGQTVQYDVPNGNVMTGIVQFSNNAAISVSAIRYRPQQQLIDGAWVTVSVL